MPPIKLNANYRASTAEIEDFNRAMNQVAQDILALSRASNPATVDAAAGALISALAVLQGLIDKLGAQSGTPVQHGYSHEVSGADPILIDEAQVNSLVTDLAGKQPLDATLTAIAALVTAANEIILATGVDTFSSGKLTDAYVATANKDGAVGTPSMRTIGTGALQSAAGSHAGQHAAAGVDPVALSDSQISHLDVGGAVTLQHVLNDMGSGGWVNGGAITDAGGQTIDVAAGSGFVRASNSPFAALFHVTWPLTQGIAIPNNTTRYVQVYWDGVTVSVQVSATFQPNDNQYIHLGEIHNDLTVLDVHIDPKPSGNIAALITAWTAGAIGIVVADGEVLSDGSTTSRYVAVTAGSVFSQFMQPVNTTAFNSFTAGTFIPLYRSATPGLWTRGAGVAVWPNTLYDDNSGTLAAIPGTRYINLWFIRAIQDGIYMLYPQNTYTTQALAEAEALPSRPEFLQEHGYFVGRITVRKNDTAPLTIKQLAPRIGSFNLSAAVSSHESLTNLQGGAVGDHSHLTAAELGPATTNVSITAHGLAPQAPNDATKFLDGTGAYSVPAGSGGSSNYAAMAAAVDWFNNGATPQYMIAATTGLIAVEFTKLWFMGA